MARPLPIAVGDLVVGGKYRVERLIGEGGMGLVVLGRHVELGNAVAIKVLRDHDDETVAKRFMREARAAANLTNDHVVRVYDVGTLDGGAPYMLMDYLEGEDLGRILQRGALGVLEAADYVIQACEGIAVAHSFGIVHRDIKPQNLFLVRRLHQSPIVKVLDFGIAKTFEGMDQVTLTQTTGIMGSPAYMSPEQMRASHEVDARTDVWSLGVVLYELLAGSVPFDGHTVADLCARVLMQQPVAIAERRGDVPKPIQEVIERCLEKDASKRLPGVSDLAAALEPFAPFSMQGTAERIRKIEATSRSSAISIPGDLSASSFGAPSARPVVHPLSPTGTVPDPPQGAHVRTAATFESLGGPVPRDRSVLKLAAIGGAAAVVCVLGVVIAVATSRSSAPSGTADPESRGVAGKVSMPADSSSEPSPMPPATGSLSVAPSPEPPKVLAGSAPAADAATRPPSKLTAAPARSNAVRAPPPKPKGYNPAESF
jgi:eukaryotic-like serine/threonine-protein kinase